MATVAITGITGLAGGHVARGLRAAGHDVVGISRRAATADAPWPVRAIADLTDIAALATALRGCDAVLHFADRADRRAYAEGDVGTAAHALLAIRTAAQGCGVRRIVAASSVYANRVDRPDDLYGRSKRAMEAACVAAVPGLPAVVLRLPPLHGPGAKGTVRHIAHAVAKGWPLPFGLAHAPRRFLSLDALADLCRHLVELDGASFARAAGQIWVPVNVAQGSLAALARTLGKAWLVPVPGIDRLLGGRVSAQQLAHDRDALAAATGWHAPD